MANNNLFILYKDGWKYISISISISIVLSIFSLHTLAFISLLLTGIFIFIFRNPERLFPVFESSSLVSPVDGVVLSIEEIDNSEFAYRLKIDSTIFDVGILRVPMSAKVESLHYTKGTKVATKSTLHSDLNEAIYLTFVNNNADRVKVIHRLKESFIPLFIDIKASQEVYQTTRYGFVNNTMTTLYIPNNFRLNVSVGSDLKASESLLGYFS
ncbi:phosphatidylserine decarboxylase [Sulfurimonas sp.]|jgi:phosphatidylserine decarboxylase|uniref:phosphatidylserine decarboxylase n=1 Tax=Sulfurimonas sp. TaxID=2022749 RepID=UPI0025DEF43A|nr:phosphatidylserine decarboxylase [Sulfurimonas sp.]MBT5934957.1 phosphatidylserine decarboxylase [Sulfurimonas sp.]